MIEAPFVGSPVCTKPGAPFGNPGNGMNLISFKFLTGECMAVSCPCTNAGSNKTNMNRATIYPNMFEGFILILILRLIELSSNFYN
jgi:hypothetical protein